MNAEESEARLIVFSRILQKSLDCLKVETTSLGGNAQLLLARIALVSQL